MYAAFRRVPIMPQKRTRGVQRMGSKEFIAPIRGWVANENLAKHKEGGAHRLDNWFPTQRGIRPRGGARTHATVGSISDEALIGTVSINETTTVTGSGTAFISELEVGDLIKIDTTYYFVATITSDTELTTTLATHDTDSGLSAYVSTVVPATCERLFTYKSGGTEKFFASTETDVFEVTTPTYTTVPPTADISSQTSGYYSVVPFTTSGGDFLYILNGTDDPQLYDGSSWTAINAGSSPSISNVTSDDLIQGWVYRNRLFFVEKESLRAWYPSVDTLGGALSSVTLTGVFKKGGALLFGATWSLDAGDGLDDKCIFVTDQGEVAVYQGTYPGDTNTWSLIGVYDISRPLGKNASLRIGGDLLILTEDGIVPISEVVRKDKAALKLTAITRPIEPEWAKTVQRRKFRPWEMVKWSEYNMGIVNTPVFSDGDDLHCYVVNLETGAWARYTNWDTRCLGIYNEWAYFGTNDGTVEQCEIGGSDNGTPYQSVYIGLYDDCGKPGQNKTVHQGRVDVIAASPFDILMGASVDYGEQLLTAPSAITNYTVDVWDVGKWDEALWDASSNPQPSSEWFSIGVSGFAIAPMLQLTNGVDPFPDLEIVSMHLTYEVGGLVV